MRKKLQPILSGSELVENVKEILVKWYYVIRHDSMHFKIFKLFIFIQDILERNIDIFILWLMIKSGIKCRQNELFIHSWKITLKVIFLLDLYL